MTHELCALLNCFFVCYQYLRLIVDYCFWWERFVFLNFYCERKIFVVNYALLLLWRKNMRYFGARIRMFRFGNLI